MKAIVTGMIATYPVGGVAWDYGQYLMGLEALGFEVYYLEDTGWMTYDPRLRRYSEDPSFGVTYLRDFLASLSASLADRWHFRAMDGSAHGLSVDRLAQISSEAELLINVSGGTLLRDEYMTCPRKLLVDTDPGWNHFRNYPRLDANPNWGGGHGYRAHDHFFTYAERIGKADCVLPALGLPWQPTRPPVVLDAWRSVSPADRWTTVLTWKNHPETIEYQGVRYGTKEMEFERVESIPLQVPAQLEIAAGGTDRPENEEEAKTWYPTRPRWDCLGWSVIDSHRVSATPEQYRRYIEASRGEFSVAKNVYVATRSGWFSCRSTCYLAASRPVVVQDTGFSEIIPCGEGLLAFTNLEEAVEAIKRVESDYPRHQAAARRISEQYFSSDVVLGDMLSRIGLG